ncbi:uncharacterized protein J7T54_007597 [Emericellopsis cladophorae]|uniref:HTH OST-type domain-containing protein n=1 Tax=Emericellopsis cladophorae TaxID=2686198 RepID=A0A9P9XWJ7_9HYPO|nr:uncharacterized protein J7T54_007597 [Emericellopsis cladophorae]KAI6779142.1 hypothetical protein J7T54_007597 [Emericellopsis cladophorae]
MASDTVVVELVVLIAADSARPSVAGALLAEVAKYDTAFVRRAYGDWTGTSLKGWKDQLLYHSIQPVQQFAYTHGKNATDSAMIIDAMDLLYSSRFDRLAGPQLGMVIGIPLHNRASLTKVHDDTPLTAQLRRAVEAASAEEGWANLAKVGVHITKQQPDFDPRSFGYLKLGDLIIARHQFDIDRRGPGEGRAVVVYARDKRQKHISQVLLFIFHGTIPKIDVYSVRYMRGVGLDIS